jgi:hypothetical protein
VPERPTLTKTQRRITAAVGVGAILIAAIGFAGSYTAVTDVAAAKGLGWFAHVLPAGIDAGIGVLLALDLLLAWLRMPYPALRQTAWLLTAATIAFNASAAWPDPLGVGMHAIIPILFIIVTEAARHAIGRTADITADKHMDSVRLSRWLLAPWPTFRLWRRMKLWELRSYDEVIRIEQDRLVYRAQLRARYGRAWRRKAPVEMVLPLRLARYGVALADAPAAIETATPVATPAAPAKRTRSAAPAPAATPQLSPAATATPAIEAAATPEPVTVAPPAANTPTLGGPYEPGTPQHVVHALWLRIGHRPTESVIQEALANADLPNSRAQAGKIRRQVAAEVEDLPGPRAA